VFGNRNSAQWCAIVNRIDTKPIVLCPEAEETRRNRSELRAETLSAARELIQKEGYEGLTIRKLAKRMECSPMALYSYFADKQALLTALALEGFEKLAKRLDSTVRRDPLTALRKILLDYIAYAEENPREYRILFLSVETLGELKLTRQDLQERNPALRALFKCVEMCVKAGVIEGDAQFRRLTRKDGG
jgi:AcrR family transcriptional regulator